MTTQREQDTGGKRAGGRDEAFEAELAGLVGKPVSSRGVVVAPDPVNQPMIRHWAAAFEDWNPVYTDPDVAAAGPASAGSWRRR